MLIEDKVDLSFIPLASDHSALIFLEAEIAIMHSWKIMPGTRIVSYRTVKELFLDCVLSQIYFIAQNDGFKVYCTTSHTYLRRRNTGILTVSSVKFLF